MCKDVVRSRFGRWGEGPFHQPAGIFSVYENPIISHSRPE